jgi:glycosyltransferase involved in cell wall biosynthesis
MSTISLAIIVPTRNSSSLLVRLVRTLQQQTADGWRVILIDASTNPAERHYLDSLVRSDSRFTWVAQEDDGVGIYGAMNIGFRLLYPNEWVLFWGSDDLASGPTAFQYALRDLALKECDLMVCRGRYVSIDHSGAVAARRATSFRWFLNYRVSLFLGSTPPHQCTLIGPGARLFLSRYDDRFRIAADLDYFLRLARINSCRVCSSAVPLVDISVGGVSDVDHWGRLSEVAAIYSHAFPVFWLIPFLTRYLQRFITLFGLP